MTHEEAQQLIAELTSKCPVVANGKLPYEARLDDVFKAIKRFANKPPYVTEIIFSFSEPMQFILYKDENHTKDASLAICHQDKRDAIGISIDELKQLRNNCSKMLEYLEENI